MVVEGQIYGGVAQGIGGALYERIAYGEEGQILNASFMDFLDAVTAAEVPRIEAVHTETPVAEQPARRSRASARRARSPSSAAIANAISDALKTPVDHMPVTPEEVLQLANGKIDPSMMGWTGTNYLP